MARVAYIWARRSTWNTITARYDIEKERTELLQRGLNDASLRPVIFKDVEWGNHFVSVLSASLRASLDRVKYLLITPFPLKKIHSDYPEEFMSMLEECVRTF